MLNTPTTIIILITTSICIRIRIRIRSKSQQLGNLVAPQLHVPQNIATFRHGHLNAGVKLGAGFRRQIRPEDAPQEEGVDALVEHDAHARAANVLGGWTSFKMLQV